ncbi:LytR/AlgR family response regulator transcription factor [Paenibacillus silagei]|uniref:Two-component system response regulator AgrA n=1 Tax=Paenibacillus silagei TaxID=1670801 RepID=A0ABS4NJ47_9BACL|nr:LytTR family DNA-binding domain-containing protein [Paenibacillus silagei]MBP2110056.1 two-component system response regulator AgrA [Paenibacillus silagei]
MKIIICENNDQAALSVHSAIKSIVSELDVSISVPLITSDPRRVIRYLSANNHSDCVYLLELKLQSELNGIDLAKIIRDYDPLGYIVFLTSSFELDLLTYQHKIKAMDYIFKFPFLDLPKRLKLCLSSIIGDFKKINVGHKDNLLTIDTATQVININISEIQFLETDINHRIKIHSLNETIECYGTLKSVESLLPSYFCKVHRSYIVNTRYIKSIDKTQFTLNMTNKETVYVSKRNMQSLLSYFSVSV